MFQALSDFGYAVHSDREHLVGQLLSRLLGTQVGDEGFDHVLDSTLKSLQSHKFMDVNPSEVDDLYRRLCARLGEFAQFDKQRALGLLQRRLVQLEEPSMQYDLQHKVLAFLYSTAQGALDSEYEGSDLVDQLLREAQSSGQALQTYLSDATTASWQHSAERPQHSGGGSGDTRSHSSLSAWSEEGPAFPDAEEDGEVTSRRACQGEEESTGHRRAPGTPSPAKAGAAAQQRRRTLAQLVPPPRESPYRRDSLAVWLADKQSGGQPARLLNPQLCFGEGELVQQELHLLKGVSQAGPAFQLDPVRGVYTVVPGVHMHTTSHAATRALLQRPADLGSALRGVQEFCAGILGPNGATSGAGAGAAAGEFAGSSAEELRQLSTTVAFAAALDCQLKALQQQLVPLEVAARSGALTLLQLEHHLEGLRRQATALQAAARQCVWRGGTAETAAGLLDAVHDMVQLELMQAPSQGGVLAAMLLQVFTATAKPYLDRLHAWVFSGSLEEDACGELFIAAEPSISPNSPKFWSSAYRLRCAADGTPAAPSFLVPLADPLLAAGKSASLLRASAAPVPSGTTTRVGAAGLPLGAGFGGYGSSGGSFGGLQPASLPSLLSWRTSGSSCLLATPRRLSSPPRPPRVLRPAQQESPTKRRLNAIQALGYDVATCPDAAHPPSGDGPSGAAVDGLLGPAAAEEGSPGTPQPDLSEQTLHGHFVSSLRQLLLPAAGSSGQRAGQWGGAGHGQQAGHTDPVAPVGHPIAPPQQQQPQDNFDGAAGGDGPEEEREEQEDWLCGSAVAGAGAACSAHMLSLSPADDLPPLPPLPRSAFQLQTPCSVISPEALPPASFAAVAGLSCSSSSSRQAEVQHRRQHGRQHGAQPVQQAQYHQGASIADCMREAARQRVQQAAGEGCLLDQLPALLQPPAALGQCGKLEGENGSGDRSSLMHADPAGTAFDGSSWAAWYHRVSVALSSQLAAIEAGLGGGGQLLLGGTGLGQHLSHPYQPGCAMWWQRPGTQQEGQLRPSPASCTHTLPLDGLLQQCLVSPLQVQAQRIVARLTSEVLQQWGLPRQLLTLREVFLLGTPLMAPFLHSLFLKISTRQGLSGVSELDLSDALEQGFRAGGRQDLLFITAEILPQPASHTTAEHAVPDQQQDHHQAATGAAAAGSAGPAPGMPTVQTLSRLRLRMECGWPLCLVASKEMLQQYNAALVLLMQVHWVKQSLDSLQYSKWKSSAHAHRQYSSRGGGAAPCAGTGAGAGTNSQQVQQAQTSAGPDIGAGEGPSGAAAPAVGGRIPQGTGGTAQQPVAAEQGGRAGDEARLQLRRSERDGVLQQMVHLVEALLQYTTERLLAAWHWLQEALAGCQSLDDVQRCHAKYLRAVQRYCLLGGDTLSRLVRDALLRLLDCALHYCWLSAQLTKAQKALAPAPAAEGAAQLAALAPNVAVAARKRVAALHAQMAAVRREFTSRQGLLARVLASRAGQAGSQAGEMRQLLTAIDYNGFFQRQHSE